MRFMILVKATADSEAGVIPSPELFQVMADYHEQLIQAGVLADANGLQPSGRGWRVEWKGGRQTVLDGPFTETKELIAGYTIINVKSREEALDWSRRFPNPDMVDCHIEIRQMFELEDFEGMADFDRTRFREMGVGTQR